MLASPDSSIKVSATEIRVESMGTDTIEVRGGANVNVQSGSGLVLKGGGTTAVEAGAGLTLKGGGSASLEGAGNVTVRGGAVLLNPVGRV